MSIRASLIRWRDRSAVGLARSALVSAVVSALVTWLYDRLSAERRLQDAQRRAEVEHDRSAFLEIDRIIQIRRREYWDSDRSELALIRFQDSLAELAILDRHLSERGRRRMDVVDPAVGMMLFALGNDFPRAQTYRHFDLFEVYVDGCVEALEQLIAGTDEPIWHGRVPGSGKRWSRLRRRVDDIRRRRSYRRGLYR